MKIRMMSETIAVCFGQFGPYHNARVAALQLAAKERGDGQSPPQRVIPVQIAASTTTYAWKAGDESKAIGKRCDGLCTLCTGMEEEASPAEVFFKARKLFKEQQAGVVFVPSYSPGRYFAIFAAAKSLGLKTVMMNESHAGTEKATGWKKWIKRQIVKQFDAALVGGAPHKRHFASLGIPDEKIFTGYDAVDGEYFAEQAAAIRADAGQFRARLGLPERYFLNLGRMVPKKNLATLVAAYGRYCDGWRAAGDERNGKMPVALVFVGSGELEPELEAQARSLGLDVVDRRGWKAGARPASTENCKLSTEHSAEQHGTVLFYGFRQLDENPVFYALAEAFILPSLHEEWGLVVNEAMAAGLPVIVSSTAGCVEDLLPGGESGQHAPPSLNPQRSTLNSLEARSNGFVFDPTSTEALAEALRRIAESGEHRADMAKRSREIVAKFSCENFARQALAAAEAAMNGGTDGC